MAMLNVSEVNFEDIRIILCAQGYSINNKYIVKEIGFWSRENSGVIPFSSKNKFYTLSNELKIKMILKIFIDFFSKNYNIKIFPNLDGKKYRQST